MSDMFSFAYGIDDRIEIKGKVYYLNLAYDSILRFLDLLQDGEVSEQFRRTTAIKILFSEDESPELTQSEQEQVIKEVVQTHILMEKPSMIFASMGNHNMKEKEYYSLLEDADIIFASFFYDYQIDLINERGRLHWKKFKALLNGLSDKTKLAQVISIRKWTPGEHSSAEETKTMRELQKFYSLDVTQQDAEELLYFNSLSDEEKEAFARKRLEELGGDLNG